MTRQEYLARDIRCSQLLEDCAVATRWRITLVFGRIELSITEAALGETGAIEAALRYARALGYGGHPDRTTSRRIRS